MADIITTLQNRDGDNLYPIAGGMINDSITTAMLKDNAVSTAKITDLAVATGKIADSAVTTAKIADTSVTTGKLADGAVTAAKLSISGANVAAGNFELYGSTPYIDFHYASTSDNYSVRVINDAANRLNILATAGIQVNGASVETVLYNNATGTNGTVALSSSATSFNYLKIIFRDNDSQYGSVIVYSPNGKRVGLHTITSAGGSNGLIKTRDISISGTSIATYSTQYAEMTVSHNGSSSISKTNQIYITRVVGGCYA